uniref:Gag polyprotein n=1 Tax=Cricetulus griseus TaxID=10029 RepID=A0A7T1TE45_CRIGR|nr:gag polyprotein [Cricetulus griseus]
MGQTVTTPLSLTLSHWKDVQEYAHNQSVNVRKRKWITLCSSEWPTFDVGWPRDGTFNPQTIFQIKEKIMDPGPHGHPDQVAYIVTWEALVQDPPPWVRPFLHPKGPSLLPPSNRSNRPIPSAPTPPTPLIPPNPPSHSNLYPTVMKDTKAKEKKTPKVLPPGEDQLVDLLTEEPPPYPPLPPPPEAEADSAAALAEAAPDPSPMAYRLRGRREQPVPDSTTLPLRTGLNGQPQYWPFSASDLYNWKNNNPSFSADPVRLTSLIESVLTTHQPTWDDCQQLLQVLLTSEEKQRVLLEARKNVPGVNGQPTQLPNEIDAACPLERPEWDFTTEAGRTHLRLYRQLLVAGLRGAGRRPTNLAQVKQIIQGAEESPAAFLERLKEAYRMYTPYNPEDPGQATNVSMSFIWQSAPDIRNKLQRLENLQGYTLQDLLKEAERIFNKRETQTEREERWRKETQEREERLRQEAEEKEVARDRKRNKEMSRLLATVVTGQRQNRQRDDRRGPHLDRDQCAYCKEKGHWARECPKNPRAKLPPPRVSDLLNLED